MNTVPSRMSPTRTGAVTAPCRDRTAVDAIDRATAHAGDAPVLDRDVRHVAV
jgi:hypothetical protein